MEERTYKTRVELSLMLEIDVYNACHEDNAGAISEEIATDLARRFANELQKDEDVYVCNWGVQCVDVEPVDYEKGE